MTLIIYLVFKRTPQLKLGAFRTSKKARDASFFFWHYAHYSFFSS